MKFEHVFDEIARLALLDAAESKRRTPPSVAQVEAAEATSIDDLIQIVSEMAFDQPDQPSSDGQG